MPYRYPYIVVFDSCVIYIIPEICQIRLDYTNFNIAQPTDAATGACGGATGDQLIIEPGATPTSNIKITPPTICGNNAGPE